MLGMNGVDLNRKLLILIWSESLMKVRKTIKAEILELRKGKEELLKREYESWQRCSSWR